MTYCQHAERQESYCISSVSHKSAFTTHREIRNWQALALNPSPSTQPVLKSTMEVRGIKESDYHSLAHGNKNGTIKWFKAKFQQVSRPTESSSD